MKKKKPHLQNLSYKMWITSQGWRNRCKEYWKKNGLRCKACGSTKQPTVHHVHYGYLGRETDNHIIGLCWSCHKEFHDKYGTKTVMVDETLDFISEKRMVL